MSAVIPPTAEVQAAARRIIHEHGLVAGARRLGVDKQTLSKASDGDPIRRKSAEVIWERASGMTLSATPAEPKPVEKVRRADEFRGGSSYRHPRVTDASSNWTIPMIKSARGDQLRGQFKLPSLLAKAFRADDALFPPLQRRLDSLISISAELVGASGELGQRVLAEARKRILTPRTVLTGIHCTLCNHGVAIGYIDRRVASDGTSVSMVLSEWPIEFVRWDTLQRCLVTRVDGAHEVPIIHGDGTWVVFSKADLEPWQGDACVLPGAIVFASHMAGIVDWSAASKGSGQKLIVGELPEYGRTGGSDITEEAEALLQLVSDLGTGETNTGIRPFGTKTEVLGSGEGAWQIFQELILSREKAAARIYLGTDAILGSQGGAPGVDISLLFGVATTKIQADIEAITRGLKSGIYDPWTAINYGDSSLAPHLEFKLPDPDRDASAKSFGERLQALLDAIDRMASQGFVVDQGVVDALADRYGVPTYQLAPTEQKKIALELAPASLDAVVRGREARASQGLPPFGDARDDLTIEQIKALSKAQGENATQPSTATPPTNPEINPEPVLAGGGL